MDSERNRILKIKEYLEDIGVEVNIGKNKARGNKGFFRGTKNGNYRIDIAKSLDETDVLPVLLHEFAHYVHFLHDNKLKSLDFAFDEFTDTLNEELVNITVDKIPKNEAKALFDKKDEISAEIKSMANKIKLHNPDFKLSIPYKKFERHFNIQQKYLLKYDRINFNNRIYSIENLKKDFYELTDDEILYIKIKSKQRMINRINSRIAKLNRYYNSPTELFARFVELFFTDYTKANKLAPNSVAKFEQNLKQGNIQEFYCCNQTAK